MEGGTVIPSRPVYPIPNYTPIPPWKFNLKAPPTPIVFDGVASSTSKHLNQTTQSQSQSCLPMESLLQHLTNAHLPSSEDQVASKPKPKSKPKPISIISDVDDDEHEFLTTKGRMMLNSICEVSVHDLPALLDSSTEELIELDLISLLKALDRCGNWQRSVAIFEWVLSNDNAVTLNSHMVELMVRILGRECEHTVAAKLFDRIYVERFSLDVRAYTTVIHAYSRTGNYERAICVFQAMRDSGLSPSLVTYNVVLDVYGKMGGCWDRIQALLDEIRSCGMEFDDFTCSTVISACGREGLVEEAKEFFSRLETPPGTVTFNALLQVLGKHGAVHEAAELMEHMEAVGCPADAFTYNEMVGAYARAGFLEEAAQVVGSMEGKGVKPNAVTYTTLIDAYGKVGREDEALRLADRMKAAGCPPNVCTYNALLAMLGKKRRCHEMIRLLQQMTCPPNRITWNTLLAVCDSLSQLDRVLSLMSGSGFRPARDTFVTLIAAYARVGSHTDAARVRAEMAAAGFGPCVATFNAVLNALARKGDWSAAESVLDEMAENGVRPNEASYALLLQCHATGGNLRGIRRIERDIIYSDDNTRLRSWVILRTLVLVNFKCRCVRGMERAYSEVTRQGYKPDIVVFNSMLSIYARNNMGDRAHEMIDAMREAGLRPDLVTFNTLMDMEARRGACWKAQEILQNLHQSGVEPDVVSYNIVIKGFCKQGLMEEAVRTLDDMTARGIVPCIFTYNTFLTGYTAKALFDDAAELLDYMAASRDCPGPNQLSYKIVVDALCRARRYQQARSLLSRSREDKILDPDSIDYLSSRIQDFTHR